MSKATSSKKPKATPKKAKAAAGEDDDESPSKKSVKGGKAKSKVKTEEGDEGSWRVLRVRRESRLEMILFSES